MGSPIKYFLFNKADDYERGYLQNMVVGRRGIRAREHCREKSVFFSRLLDSRETEMCWHRLRLRGEDGKKTALCLSVYAGNQRSFYYRDKETDIEEFIRREDIPLEEKKKNLSPWLQKETAGMDDILLHDVKGRYLWILVEMYWQYGMAGIGDIQVFFPGVSWIEYLPEIYQKEDKDSFLERYLGIFQTLYEDFDRELVSVPNNLDMELAKGKDLAWLAQWLGIREGHIWSEEQMRKLLFCGVDMYRRRGTRQGIMDFVELYTGERPFLVEYHQLLNFREDRMRFEKMCRLYGGDAYSFTVLVREEAADSVWRRKTLVKIIEDVKPAHMECSLVILKPYLFLDMHSYIGVNSVLGKYTGMALDGHSAIPFAVLQKN